MSVIESQEDLEEIIKVRAYFLSEENLSFNDLCWKLAEKLIKVQRKGRIDIDDIKKKAEEIYKQHNNYDELCWRIAELAIVGKVNEKKDLFSQNETKPQEVKEVFEAKNKFLEEPSTQFKELEEKLIDSEPQEIRVEDLVSSERLSCPKCGAVGHIIKLVDDKSKVLSYMGSRPIYRKKHICRNCGQEF